MADDDTLTTASTYWRDAAVLAETFQQKKRPPPKPPTPDLTGMPKLKEHARIQCRDEFRGSMRVVSRRGGRGWSCFRIRARFG